MTKILHLTLHRKWFEQIAKKQKIIEYREIKTYWTKRLENKQFDEIHFKNGYSKNAPFMRIKLNKIIKNKEYELHLGKILEIKNYQIIK